MTPLKAIKSKILDVCAPLSREEEAKATDDQLVKHNLRYMTSAFKSYLKHMSYDEYISEIFAGMYEAAKRYDRKGTNRYATYAKHYVSVFLWCKCYSSQSTISINPMAWKRINKIRKFYSEFYRLHGQKPTMKDIREHFSDWTEKNLMNQLFYEKAASGVSLDSVVSDNSPKSNGETKTLADILKPSNLNVDSPYAKELTVAEEVEQRETYKSLMNGVKNLQGLDKKIITEIFIEGIKPKDVAKKFDLKLKEVNQIKNRALKKLKSALVMEAA